MLATADLTGYLLDLAKVVAIDLMLAGDNVIVLGALVARLPADQRRSTIRKSMAISLACLIGFGLLATWLLRITGVLLAGGLLLLWVAWKLWRELHHSHTATGAPSAVEPVRNPILAIVLADLSMSLDNVLAVAGAAHKHPAVLFIGLALSVTLTGLAASLIAKVIERHRWLAFAGVAMILYVAISMMVEGWATLPRF